MADVIEFNGGFRMYYTMSNLDSTHIRYANSPDGINWTDGGVILKNDTSSAPSNRMRIIGGPSVVKLTSGQYRMYMRVTEAYTTTPKYHVRSAISNDGTNFTMESGIRIEIFPYDSSSVVQLAGHGTYFLNNSGGVTAIFSGDPTGQSGPSNLFIATSNDGLNFTNFIDKYTDYHDPIVVKTGTSYILYATYLLSKQGKAISADGINWPAQMDSVSFQDSLGNVLTEGNDGVGDIAGLYMPNGQVWLYTNYGNPPPSRNIALFKSSITTSIEQNELLTHDYKIYPNPLQDMFTIELSTEKKFIYTITDIQGKVIKSGTLINKQTIIDLSKHESGIYLLNIDRQILKIVKQ